MHWVAFSLLFITLFTAATNAFPTVKKHNYRWTSWSGWTPCEEEETVDWARTSSRTDRPEKPIYRNCYTRATRRCMNPPFGLTHDANCIGESAKIELCDLEFNSDLRCRAIVSTFQAKARILDGELSTRTLIDQKLVHLRQENFKYLITTIAGSVLVFCLYTLLYLRLLRHK
uniref:Cnidarian restricted protein n=1 Tax=Clytia hemisphaerica TaxID=252671 RepID=A0A7M5WJT7_9CNID